MQIGYKNNTAFVGKRHILLSRFMFQQMFWFNRRTVRPRYVQFIFYFHYYYIYAYMHIFLFLKERITNYIYVNVPIFLFIIFHLHFLILLTI